MSEDRSADEERKIKKLLAYRELIWELVGFTPEQAERNMKKLEECNKRMGAKVDTQDSPVVPTLE